jgi:hypothetical protein
LTAGADCVLFFIAIEFRPDRFGRRPCAGAPEKPFSENLVVASRAIFTRPRLD